MNVASLELCKELYELSGWGHEVAIQWWIVSPAHKIDGYEYEETSYVDDYSDRAKKDDGEYAVPAYPLGYLLRKLPKFVDGAEFWLTNDGFSWTAGYATDKYADGKFHFTRSESADTPEDAACKLCIELFKQGVLK